MGARVAPVDAGASTEEDVLTVAAPRRGAQSTCGLPLES